MILTAPLVIYATRLVDSPRLMEISEVSSRLTEMSDVWPRSMEIPAFWDSPCVADDVVHE